MKSSARLCAFLGVLLLGVSSSERSRNSSLFTRKGSSKSSLDFLRGVGFVAMTTSLSLVSGDPRSDNVDWLSAGEMISSTASLSDDSGFEERAFGDNVFRRSLLDVLLAGELGSSHSSSSIELSISVLEERDGPCCKRLDCLRGSDLGVGAAGRMFDSLRLFCAGNIGSSSSDSSDNCMRLTRS